jgi:hypothetical protein
MRDEPPLHTVYADFNNRDGNSLGLSCNGTTADLDRLGLVLREGLQLRVSDVDLAAVGQVRWVPERQEWMIDVDDSTYQELR